MKVLIVDDEKPARDRLRRLLDELDGYDVVAEATNGEAAIAASEAHHPDIALMDIRMPGMDGIEAARHLAASDTAPAVIFATAFNEYALDAFDAQAVGYLMKPVRRERLERALEHARKLSANQLDALRDEDDTPHVRTHFSARISDIRIARFHCAAYIDGIATHIIKGHVGMNIGYILVDHLIDFRVNNIRSGMMCKCCGATHCHNDCST